MSIGNSEEYTVALPAASGLAPEIKIAESVGLDVVTASTTSPISGVLGASGGKTKEQEAEEELKRLSDLFVEKALQAGVELEDDQAEAMMRKFRDDNPTEYEKFLKAQADEITVYVDVANPEGVFVSIPGSTTDSGVDYFLALDELREKKEYEELLAEQQENAKAQLEENAEEFKAEREVEAEEWASHGESSGESVGSNVQGNMMATELPETEAAEAAKEVKRPELDLGAKDEAGITPTPKPSAKTAQDEKDLVAESGQLLTAGRSSLKRGNTFATSSVAGNESAVQAAAAQARDSFVNHVGSAADAAGADLSQQADAVAGMAASAAAASPVPSPGARSKGGAPAPKGGAVVSPFSGAAEEAKQRMEEELKQRLEDMGMSGEIRPPKYSGA